MKLCSFSESLDRIISREEIDLEREVLTAKVTLALKRGEKVVIHSWEYERETNNEGI